MMSQAVATAPLLSSEVFSRVGSDGFRALGRRLRALQVDTSFPELFQLADATFEPANRVIRTRELRRSDGEAARLLRLFWVGDTLSREEAAATLGAGLFDALMEARILFEGSAGVRAALRIARSGNDLLLAEELSAGPDAVMAVGPHTPLLLRAALPSKKLGSLLDLGCGAGALAIGLASHFERVVATDINERATAFTTANAALAGIANIETRAGDLFAPVVGMTFDRIVCQPPFMAAFEGDGKAGVTRTGGTRGDELPLRAMAGAAQHLAPMGRALFSMNWMITDELAIADRVRAAVGPSVDVLVVDIADLDPGTLAVGSSMYDDPSLGPKFEEAAYGRYRHYKLLGAESVKATLVVLSRPAPERSSGFTATFELSTSPHAELAARDVDAWLEAHALIAAGPDAIARAGYVLRPDVQLARLGDGSVIVDAPSTSALPRVTIAAATAELLDKVRRAKTGAEAIRRHVKDTKGQPAAATRAATSAIEAFLRKGVLEVAR
jgi:SAM-dependent methyltransferase